MKRFLLVLFLIAVTFSAQALTYTPWWMIQGSADAAGVASFGVPIVTSGSVTASGSVILSGTNAYGFLGTNTTDEADNRRLILGGGSAPGVTRGGYIAVWGNEAANPGTIEISTGNVSGGSPAPFMVYTRNAYRFGISETGNASFSGNVTIAPLAGVGARPISADANGVIAITVSDERLKTNIETIPNALDKVLSLRGVSFDWKQLDAKEAELPAKRAALQMKKSELSAIKEEALANAPAEMQQGMMKPGEKAEAIQPDPDVAAKSDEVAIAEKEIADTVEAITRRKALGSGKEIGLIAQEVERVVPEVVRETGPDKIKSVNYPQLVGLLVEAMKEQNAKIVDLEKRIKALEGK